MENLAAKHTNLGQNSHLRHRGRENSPKKVLVAYYKYIYLSMWSSQPSESRSSSMVFFHISQFLPSRPKKTTTNHPGSKKTHKKKRNKCSAQKIPPDPTTTSILWLPPKRRWCRFEWVQKSSQLPMDGRGSAGLIDEGQTSQNMGPSSLQGTYPNLEKREIIDSKMVW